MTELERLTMIRDAKATGFKVYMRDPSDTWLYFTDGVQIGYLQCGLAGYELSTCHRPNRNTGGGFRVANDIGKIDRATLERAFITAPAWATRHDVETVKKWKDWEEFQNANQWNRGLEEQ